MTQFAKTYKASASTALQSTRSVSRPIPLAILLAALLALTLAVAVPLGLAPTPAFAEDQSPSSGILTTGTGSPNTPTATASSWGELAQAVATAETESTITINNSFRVGTGDPIVIPAGKTITLAGNNTSIESNGKTSVMFKVEAGATLALAEGLTLNGGYHCPIVESAGAVVLEGAKIRQAKNFAVKVSGPEATFTSTAGEIAYTYCSAYGGSGLVVRDGAQATIEDVSIHDCWNSASGSAGLFIRNAQVIMNGGTISKNSNSSTSTSAGAGVYVNASDSGLGNTALFVMNGGTISENRGYRGGGVHIEGSDGYDSYINGHAQFIFNNGIISENYAGQAGGGIWVIGNAECIMNGGTISANTAQYYGGGVGTFDTWTVFYGMTSYARKAGTTTTYGKFDAAEWPDHFPGAFIMNDGVIEDNISYKHGGGIYVASEGVYLNQGVIRNNITGFSDPAALTGAGTYAFGGGVYVASVPYTMHVAPLSVHDNYAQELGGGMWFCPTGEATIGLNDGVIFYSNTSDGAADDLATVKQWYGRYNITVSERALGGGLANWYKDGAQEPTSSECGFADKSALRYIEETEDSHTPIANIETSSKVYNLKSVASPEAIEAGKAYATVEIYGNKAPRGGGIGSNGGVIVGTVAVPISVKVAKSWLEDHYIEGLEVPEAITVYLVSAGQRIESAQLHAENNWETVFTGLPTNIPFTIEEDAPAGWYAVYSMSENGEEGSVSKYEDAQIDEFGNLVFSFMNKPITGRVEISKQTILNGVSHELPGATLIVHTGDGNIATDAFTGENLTWKSTEQPRLFSLAPGTYTLTEDQAPLGYLVAESITFVVDETGKVTVGGEDVAGKVVMLDEPEETIITEEPETPLNPPEPQEPETPSTPEQPTTPEKPTTPEQPTVPEQPTQPETPTQPGVPEPQPVPTTITANPTPSAAPYVATGPVTRDAISATLLGAIIGLALAGLLGMALSRRKDTED